MSEAKTMAVQVPQEEMWQLVDNRRKVRMTLPSLPIAGLPKPLRLNMDLEASVVDKMIERLLVLRAQMVPPPEQSRKH